MIAIATDGCLFCRGRGTVLDGGNCARSCGGCFGTGRVTGPAFPRAMALGEVWTGETFPGQTMLAAALAAALAVAPAPNRGDDLHGSTARSIDYKQIDPGVRRLVRWLNELGYETTDSGDGVSKPAAGDDEAETHPHVYIRTSRAELLDTADLLKSDLAGIGVDVANQGPDLSSPSIQASYDPGDVSSAIALHGVSDADFPAEVCFRSSLAAGAPLPRPIGQYWPPFSGPTTPTEE